MQPDPVPPSVRSRHDLTGLLFMLGSVFCLTVMVTFVKLLREGGMGTFEVMVWRMAPSLPFVWFALARRGVRLRPRRPGPVLLRALFGGLAMATYFWAVQSLSLFQNTVVQLAQPVFVAVLAPFVLAERLRGAAIVALFLALAGALVVIAPDSMAEAAVLAAVPMLPGFVRLASAACSAFAHMAIRLATAERLPGGRTPEAAPDDPDLVVFHFTAWVSLVCIIIAFANGSWTFGLDAEVGWPTVVAIFGTATAGVLGQLLLSRAYSLVPAPRAAIVEYAAIPMSMAADWAIWGAPVASSGIVGAVMMVLAGIVLVYASRRETL